MKKRLLITLGCSMTEGEGCYDFSINPKKLYHKDLTASQRELTFESFHKNGWPNKVGKALNFDKVINLGKGGSGNSTHLKLFVDKILPQIHTYNKEYDVFLIWMMTEPTRFSFYGQTKINNFLPVESPKGITNSTQIEKGYIEFMDEFVVGPIREQIFLIKLAESLFKENNIIPFYTSWNSSFSNLREYYTNDNIVSQDDLLFILNDIKLKNNPENMCQVTGCGHPNQGGYQIIANCITKCIYKNRPEFIGKNKGSKFEWEWDGGVVYSPPKQNKYF